MQTNQTIETLLKHVSVREFTDEKVGDDQVELLLRSAQAAASSNFLQAYSIIEITDEELKEDLAALSGDQPFIATASNFFIFCADLHRNEELMIEKEVNISQQLEGADAFIVATVDASLAAQNLVVAAESMGLGTCYIGGVRENIVQISQLLELPNFVYPVFGVVVGHPAHRNAPKPRLPLAAVYSENRYNPDTIETMWEYDEALQDYYARRAREAARAAGEEAGEATPHRSWSQGIAHTFFAHPRSFMMRFLNRRGWLRN
jgi:FMN reductase (NADPH)